MASAPQDETPVRIITQTQVARLLPMNACIDLMADALRTLARGDAVVPERQFVRQPDGSGTMIVMPSFLGDPRSLGVKVITLFPRNAGTAHPAIQGAVLLYDTKNGRLLAVMDANEITAVRTAACSGLATRLLAREDAGDLAMLGSGVQARSHLDAVAAVRPLRRVRVWSRNGENAKAFAERESDRAGVAIEPVESVQAAVDGADLICAVTASSEPILNGDWLRPGAHVNSVGVSGNLTERELDSTSVARSRVVVDSRVGALTESGDVVIPIEEGVIREQELVELGQVLLGAPGRTSPDEITLFKSYGIAVEDAASAHYIYREAQAQGVGTLVNLSA